MTLKDLAVAIWIVVAFAAFAISPADKREGDIYGCIKTEMLVKIRGGSLSVVYDCSNRINHDKCNRYNDSQRLCR